MSRPFTVIDLFCGAGGMALGFNAAGCQIVAGVDNDEKAAETFKQNFHVLQPDTPPLVLSGPDGNLAEPDFQKIWRGSNLDVLVGGPPCQGFSRVGRGKLNSLSPGGFENDPRNTLYQSFLKALGDWQPRCVVMENVPGMLNVRGANFADTVAAEISGRGYDVGYAVLNSSWFGVPQYRERIFFVGFRCGLGLEPNLPRPTHDPNVPDGYEHSVPTSENNQELPLEGIRFHYQIPVRWAQSPKRVTTVGDAIGDLPELKEDSLKGVPRSGRPFSKTHKYGSEPRGEFAELMRSWTGFPKSVVVDNHVCRSNWRDYDTFKKMKVGDRYPQALAIAYRRLHEWTGDTDAFVRPRKPIDETIYRVLKKAIVPPYPNDSFVDKWRKLIPGEPSWTVTAHLAKDGYSHIHYDDDQARTITVREAARLQSFPDAFTFRGNLGDRFRQIGNAVPPLLARRLAETIVGLLRHVRDQ